tara:strand:+ start:193 stop:459 length:267 start_codon:yes stop_codon:yes gene_type:complete
MEFVSVENVDMVMRQTNYTKEEAEKKLDYHDNKVLEVVKEYLDIQEKTEDQKNHETKNTPENLRNIKNMRNILKQSKPLKSTMEHGGV